MGIRKKLNNTPDWLYAIVIMPYWALHPRRRACLLLPHRDCWFIIRRGAKFFAPTPNDSQSSFLQDYKQIYSNEKVNVDYGDVVCDCGACIGEFTVSIANRASEIIAIEPEPRNLSSLRKNVALWRSQNVKIVEKALWNCKDIIKLQIKKNSVAHSLFPSANESTNIRSVEIQADTLDNILNRLGIEKVDFIKMNIEGAELEALEGAKETLKAVKKVIVEAHHIRENKETSSHVHQFLDDIGFTTYIDSKHFVYAWKSDKR